MNRDHLIKTPWLLFLLTGTLVMMAVMLITSATLNTTTTPLGIVNLEFAYNTEKAHNVLEAWRGILPADNIFMARLNTWLDFIFLLFYSLFLYHACRLTASFYSGHLAELGRYLATGALVAGAFDMIENAGMLYTLEGNLSPVITLLTFIFSVAKWILALSALVYLLVAGAWVLYNKKSGKRVSN